MPSKTIGLILGALLLVAPPALAETLYGSDGAQGHLSNLYILDPATGAVLSTVGAIGFAVTGLAVHPATGVLYGSTSNQSPVAPGSLVRIDKTTGAGTLIGSFSVATTNNTMSDLTFTRDGTLYGWASSSGDLYTIDLATGKATQVSDSSVGGQIGSGLAADASDTLYLAIETDDGELLILDRGTGLPVGQVNLDGTTDEAIPALAFNAAGTLFGVRLHNFPPPNPSELATLITINKTTGHITEIGPTVTRLDAIAFDSGVVCPGPAGVPMVAAVLPSSRSVQVGTTATAFVTVINTGAATASGVGISLQTGIPATFSYQTTSCATNALTGNPNTPVDIGAGAPACYAIFVTPTAPFGPVEVAFNFAGCNTAPVGVIVGVNTLLLSGSATPVPDIVALAATINNDGIVNIPGVNGTGVFSVAVSNVGIAGAIIASADTGSAALPVNVSLCQTDPVTGACISAIGPSVPFFINAGATATFGIFVQGTGFIVPFDPGNSRVFVRFKDAGGVTRGATSVAARTQ
ncbi:MAG TPA: hypothetical protein VGT40_08500 [Methylomirabilota bacterium]|jgi:hypothetical protein|nr:hypothetical protein [Methylomirabilota bacterium]